MPLNIFRLIIISLVFVFLTLCLSELSFSLKRKNSPAYDFVKQLRNTLLPVVSLFIIFTFVFELSTKSILFKLLKTIAGVVFALNLNLLVRTLFTISENKRNWQFQIPNILFQVIRVISYLSVTVVVLSGVWGIDLTAIAEAAGVGSLVIALALQDTLSNLVSGFLLILESPFKVGDWIMVGDYEGEVIEINWRAVRLMAADREVVVIPNGLLGSETIKNYKLIDPLHRIRIEVSFSSKSAPNYVCDVLESVAKATGNVEQSPEPKAYTATMDDGSIGYIVDLFTLVYQKEDAVKAEFFRRLYYAAKRYDLDIGEDELGVLSESEIVSQLDKIGLFSALTDDQKTYLARHSVVEFYGEEEIVTPENKPEVKLRIILSGRVELSKKINNQTLKILSLSDGSVLNETSVVDDQNSEVAVSACSDLQVLAIQSSALLEMIKQNSNFSNDTIFLIERRARQIKNKLEPQSKNQATVLSRFFD